VTRTVVFNMTISLDGRVTGPGGSEDMDWVVPHVLSDEVRDYLDDAIASATTAVMGSVNADGFAVAWPPVADDLEADARDRRFAQWLNEAEKIVLTSRAESPWPDAVLIDRPAVDVIRKLKDADGGDILILNSISVAMPLLDAGLIDRLDIVVLPEILGAGRTLFESPIGSSKWTLESVARSQSGALALRYARGDS
jgi:dihydrofolate reductase